MEDLQLGQRWISEMEPELGLGRLVEVSGKRIRICFEGSDCTRQYLLGAAPLRRVRYALGDTIISLNNQKLTVIRVEEQDGLLVYHGDHSSLHETELAHHMGFTSPKDRMAAGVFSSLDDFDLRYDAHLARHDLDSSDILGFTGGRVDLIPHQFYIASEVSNRHIPRVLLADETGLGKTIEACLIIHRLLLCERIGRVLILLPESLIHQWFVELYRRFNLVFRIVDHEHCRSWEEAHLKGNPFEDDQLILCSLDFAVLHKKRQHQIIDASWDMVVVDEAHHLAREKGDALGFLSRLGDERTGMLLLSATPEQLGRESHFALLRLLDPARYPDFESYLAETETYCQIAFRIEQLFENEDSDTEIRRILDTHGPGRAVFRNTRATISGFPRRRGILYPLDHDQNQDQDESQNQDIYQNQTQNQTQNLDRNQGHQGLNQAPLANSEPEPLQGSAQKPFGENKGFSSVFNGYRAKAEWLVQFLKKVPGEKVLVICSSRDQAVFLNRILKQKMNIKIALFHEKMSLIERDRKAAWFSQEGGARLLISSEIGSEGRNFQFARHLVMGDLPLNPELLEQRIGRLDRIGQTREIFIHVPYLSKSPEEALARWYQHGTGIFEKNVSGIHLVGIRFEERLAHILARFQGLAPFPEKDLSQLIRETRIFTQGLGDELAKGKDRLLELASFRPGKTDRLLRDIRLADEDGEFEALMLAFLDHFEIEVEEVSSRIYRLGFTDLGGTKVPLPIMKRNPVFVTFDRKLALVREDLEFLSRDHPMVMGSLDLFFAEGGGEAGNTALADLEGTEGAGILLEVVYLLECVAPKRLQVTKYLPRTPVRVVVNHLGEDVTPRYPHGEIRADLTPGDPEFFREFPEIQEQLLPDLVSRSQVIATDLGHRLIREARKNAQSLLGEEVGRLTHLQTVNPAIRKANIRAVEAEARELDTCLGQAQLRLDALRLIRIM